MIAYTEKGYGLHLAIAAAGHALHQVDNEWIASDDAAVQVIIDGYTLDQAKAYVCNQVITLATEKFNQAIAGYSPGELAGWAILRAEATAYMTDPATATPSILAEAQMRGCTVAQLVLKVLANVQYYDGLRAQIAGTSGKHRDAITSLPDFASVLSYDFSAGWPGV